MKKNLLFHTMLRRAMAVVMVAGAAFCASAETIDVGYASTAQDQVYPYDGVATNEDASVYVAAILTPEMMQTYSGGRIVGLRMGWSCSYLNGDIELFIRENDLDAENKVTQKGTAKFGWNEFKLDTPYEISENPGSIVIGYHVNTKAGTLCIPHSWLNKKPKDSFYITKDEFRLPDGTYEWEDVSQPYGALLIVAIVDPGSTDLNDRAEIDSMTAPEIFKQGETGNGQFVIANRGTNAINKFKLRYEIDGKSAEYNINLSSPIVPNSTSKVFVPIAAIATGEATVSISEVNGNPNGFEDFHTLPILAVPEDVAENYTRRPLLEYYGSEGVHYNVMYYDEYFIGAYAGYEDKMSIVCHHANDQFMTRDDEDTQMLVDLADGEKSGVQIPCMTLDRSIQSANYLVFSNNTVAYSVLLPTPYAEAVYNEALAVPTFANLSITNGYDAETDEITLNVSGYVEPGVLPEGEKLKLTVYLLEDNVSSTSQDWADAKQEAQYGGVYDHQNVIRQQPVPIWGVELDGDGEFSKEFKTEIYPEEWKYEDMHVVALLHRSENNARLSRQVINCAEVRFVQSSIHEITTETQGQRIFTISGVEVTDSKLPAGVYIVTDGATTKKMFIK